MVRRIDWENQIGRRLKLRDLHVLATVVECGTMAKAAARLGVSQPAVSEVVADLESAVGVRLFDRSARGVELTVYGATLHRRIIAAFDELKQGIRDMEAIGDPSAGELWIGCPLPIMATVIAPVVQEFTKVYPNVVVHVDDVTSPASDLRGLRGRKHDLVLARRITDPEAKLDDDIHEDVLFRDRLVVAAGVANKWHEYDNVTLADLVQEPWVMTPQGSWNARCLESALTRLELPAPSASVVTLSIPLRVRMLSSGPFLAVFPMSLILMNHERYPIAPLPIDLGDAPWPVAIFTLKNRMMNPLVERFVTHLKQFTAGWQAQLDTAIADVHARAV